MRIGDRMTRGVVMRRHSSHGRMETTRGAKNVQDVRWRKTAGPYCFTARFTARFLEGFGGDGGCRIRIELAGPACCCGTTTWRWTTRRASGQQWPAGAALHHPGRVRYVDGPGAAQLGQL